MGSAVGTGSAASRFKDRACNRCIAIGALSGERGELVHRELGRRLRLIARHAGLRQLAFGLPQFELSIDAGGNAAARDGDDIFALRCRAFGDVRQGVFTIQLDIGLRDGAVPSRSLAFSTSSSAEWVSAWASCTAFACLPKKSRSQLKEAPACPIQKVCPASGGGMM